MRYLIRPAKLKDLPDILSLTRHFPLCSLPSNKLKLKEKIKISQKSFDKTLKAFQRNYIFVLEDIKKRKIIGSSQILSYFGPKRSVCYYLDKKNKTLKIKAVTKDRHQIGGLILNPQYRKSKELLGLQIGMARFLYIKSHPKIFSKIIEVSLTAPIQQNKNPFWRETGGKIFNKNYFSALKDFQKNRENFLKAFPKNLKIHLKDLSPPARACLNTVHFQTLPVYKGLLKRGFYKSQRYHLLDGGIYLEAEWKKLPFLKQAQDLKIQYKSFSSGSDYLIAQKTKNGFVCLKLAAQKHGKNLSLQKTSRLEEGKKATALKLPI